MSHVEPERGGRGCRDCGAREGHAFGCPRLSSNLYDIAKHIAHDAGFPWTDPRTLKTYQPPECKKPHTARKRKTGSQRTRQKKAKKNT